MIRLNFRDRLLTELTELIPAETEPSALTPPAAPPARSRRRRMLLATAATAAAGIAAALILPMLGGPTGSTPAWAIERGEDGDVLVTVREVDDPIRLQEDLRAAGVAAVVRAGSDSCATWSVESEPELPDVLREDVSQHGNDHFWRIDAQALRPGHFLAFLITRSGPIGTPDGNGPRSAIGGYGIIVTATDNPPCAPLPGRNRPSSVPSPTE